jgi:hypothetical protein
MAIIEDAPPAFLSRLNQTPETGTYASFLAFNNY